MVNKIIGNNSPAYLPSGVELNQVSEFIKKYDIVSVLAHPAAGSFPGKGHYKEVLPPIETVEQLMPEFLEAGVQGLEVFYPGHSEDHQKELLGWAEAHGLIVTGGSDCHDVTERPPGVCGITHGQFSILKDAVRREDMKNQ